MLLAHVHLQQGKKSVDGIYAMAWAAPSRYRRVMKFPEFTETEVVDGNKIFRKRNTKAVPLLVWQLDETMQVFQNLKHYDPAVKTSDGSNLKIRKVTHERINGTSGTCEIVDQGTSLSKLCVDAATNEPLTLEMGFTVRELSTDWERYEFSDYQPFQGKFFPRKLTYRSLSSQAIEVRIDKLIATPAFPADEFVPPSDAEAFSFCSTPEDQGEVRPSFSGIIPIGFRDLDFAMYFQVDVEGGVRYAEVVYSNAPLMNNEILQSYIGTHFPVRRCAGAAIPYETVVHQISGHLRPQLIVRQ